MHGGVKRGDLWITSKLWNDKHAEQDVIPACRQSLADLQTGLSGHLPGPLAVSQLPSAEVRCHLPRSGCQTIYSREFHEDLAAIGEAGRYGPGAAYRHVEHDHSQAHLAAAGCAIRPAVNEMELHPHFQQPALFQFVLDHGIVPVGYCPIGSPARPQRDRTPEDTVDIEDPVIVRIAERSGSASGGGLREVGRQRGQTPIPLSSNRRHYLANLQSSPSADRSPDEEMRAIAGIDKNCRLIKGQVFLWKDGRVGKPSGMWMGKSRRHSDNLARERLASTSVGKPSRLCTRRERCVTPRNARNGSSCRVTDVYARARETLARQRCMLAWP